MEQLDLFFVFGFEVMYFIFQKHVLPQFRAVMTIFLENKVPSGDPTVPSKEFKGIFSRKSVV